MKLSKSDQSSLIWLRMTWEDAYKITLEEGGIWQALSLQVPTDILTADSPTGLRDMMREHHARVKREARQS